MLKTLIIIFLCFSNFLNVFASNENIDKDTAPRETGKKSSRNPEFIRIFQQNKKYENLLFENIKNILNSNKNKLEVELGGGVGTFNYNIDTTAHSLLKWRDSKSSFGNLKLSYEINSKNKVYLSGQYYKFSGGEMTDDDFNNSNGSFAAYNITKSMRGSGYELELGLSSLIMEHKTNQLWLLYGIANRDYTMKPKGVMQVVINGTSKTASFYNSEQESQHTNTVYRGVVVGGEFVKNNHDDNKYIAQLKFFLPLQHHSKQSYWGYNGPGYDWKLEQNELSKTFGFDLKLENKFKISTAENVWLGIYVFYKYMQGKNLAEIDWKSGSFQQVGSSANSELEMTGIGLNISF